MDYCGPQGIPYLEFIDPDGRWDPISRSAALEWQARHDARCGSCGQVKADWLGDDGVELVPPPLVVEDSWCPGCAALERRRRNEGTDEKEPGVRLGFTPNEGGHVHRDGDD